MVFLLFLGTFHLGYVNWAEQNVKQIAETQLSARSGYDVKIDSVAVSLSSLTLFRVRVLAQGEEIAEASSLTLREPSILTLVTKRKLVARRVEAGAIQTARSDVRDFFEEQATFSSDAP